MVSLRLALDASGQVTGLNRVGESSRMLWKPTERAIRDAGPFPPPPGGGLKIELGIHYDLD